MKKNEVGEKGERKVISDGRSGHCKTATVLRRSQKYIYMLHFREMYNISRLIYCEQLK